MTAAVPKSQNLSRYCALLAAGIGAVGLIGWIFGITVLQRIHPALVTMKANTAIALVLASFSLFLLQNEKATGVTRWLAQLLATVIVLLGLFSLSEYLFGWDWGIDQFFFRESFADAGQSFPGRMGIAATVVFICLGMGLLGLDTRLGGRYWATQFTFAAAMVTTLVSLYYFFGIQQGEAVPKYAPIALHTVVAFYALCAGIFFVRPNRGFMLELLGPSVGSEVARRMLPGALFLPILLGSIIILGERVGLFGMGFGEALLVVLIVLIFTGLIRTTAVAINRQEAERQRAEVMLRRNEADLLDFVENAPVGLHWVGRDGIIIWANQTELDVLGYTKEEYIGHPITEFHADVPVIDDILARLAKGESLSEYAARMRCKDGSIRHVLINSNVSFEDGEFIHTRCFTRDVTESRDAEAAQARLAAIVMTTNDAIISKTLDGTIITWNPGAENIFGYTADEMIGRSILRLIPPDLRDEENMILERLAAGELISHYETERVRKDGSRLPVSLTISPIYSTTGKIISISKIVRDITQRKQAEEALRASENLKSSILDSALDAIITMDHEGIVSSFNPAAERTFGFRSKEIVGHKLAEMIIPERLRERHYQGLAHYLASGEGSVLSRRIEVPALHADGHEFDIELSINRITGFEPPLFTATLRDITELRRSQAALIDAKEYAEAASRAKDDFLAALSHELRTPLTPVLMMATALGDDPTLPPKMRDQLAMMRRNIELEARLIDDLLDLTRISHGKLAILPVVTDVHKVLDHTAEIVLSDRLSKDVNIVFTQEAAQHYTLADPSRLQQVFWNVIKNAIKFTSSGDTITVSTRNDANGRIIITVEDTGVGISAEALPHIFKVFEQGDATGHHRYGGLGLGLSTFRKPSWRRTVAPSMLKVQAWIAARHSRLPSQVSMHHWM